MTSVAKPEAMKRDARVKRRWQKKMWKVCHLSEYSKKMPNNYKRHILFIHCIYMSCIFNHKDEIAT